MELILKEKLEALRKTKEKIIKDRVNSMSFDQFRIHGEDMGRIEVVIRFFPSREDLQTLYSLDKDIEATKAALKAYENVWNKDSVSY